MSDVEEYLDLAQKAMKAVEDNKTNTRPEIKKIEDAVSDLHARLYDDWYMEQ